MDHISSTINSTMDTTPIDQKDKVPSESLIPKMNNILRDTSIIKTIALNDEYTGNGIASPSLGSGTNGQVIKVRHIATGEMRALKKISYDDKGAREVTLHYLSQKECKYVTKIYDIYINNSRGQNYFYMVMELCHGGELFDAMIGQKARHYGPKEYIAITKQVVDTLLILHNKLGIAHRDIKPENLLLVSANPKDPPEIRLSDFGFAKQARDQSNSNNLKTACYTPYYAAPEVFGKEKYDLSCDVWSLGVLIYIMLVGRPPFYSLRGNDGLTPNMKNKISIGDFDKQCPAWNKLSPSAKDMIQNMLKVDASQRLNIGQVANHKFLAQEKDDLTQLFDTNMTMPSDQDDHSNQLNIDDLQKVNEGMNNNLTQQRIDEDMEFKTDTDIADRSNNRRRKHEANRNKKFGPKS